MVPIRTSAWVLALSTLTWVVAPLPIRSLKRFRSRSAPASWARSLASIPSACSIWASIWRESSVNSRSPSLTLAPSSKCTARMVVSSRDFNATLEIGVTVPIASTSTGTGLRSAVASSTETTRGRCGPCALAPVPIHEERVTNAAADAPTSSTPAKIIKPRFFITSHVDRSTKDRDGPVFPTLDGVLRLILTAYHSLIDHGMPRRENFGFVVTGPRHANCHLERQLDPPEARSPADLAARFCARYRLSAGDQMPRRGVPARSHRSSRLQRRNPWPEGI